MKKRRNGFTLIELLSVIVILAIIAVISTPIIIGTIEDSKKSAFKRSAEMILSALSIDVYDKDLDGNYTYTISDGIVSDDVKINNIGNISGKVEFDENGNSIYAIYNEKWCVKKTKNNVIKMKDYVNGECALPGTIFSIIYNLEGGIIEENIPTNYTEESETFKLVIPEKNGYSFRGWYTNPELVGETQIKIENGTEGNKIYYAKWEQYKDYTGVNIYDVVKDEAISDNMASLFVDNEKGINFGNGPDIANGFGVYMVSTTEEDDFPVYYYRGDVKNNNLIFGEQCWKIVRTTETGGTKLIYNGLPVNGVCNNTGSSSQLPNALYSYRDDYKANFLSSGGYSYKDTYQLKYKKYTSIAEGVIFSKSFTYEDGEYILNETYTVDENFIDNRFDILSNYHYTCLQVGVDKCEFINYVYYVRDSDKNMYYITMSNNVDVATALSNSVTNTPNETESSIKKTIDSWFETNLLSYEDYLEDTVWCNDRSIYQKSGWEENGRVEMPAYYGGYGRVAIEAKPSLICPNNNDKFTKNSNIGNGALDYPVGMLTVDESALGGYLFFLESKTYLNNDGLWWTMSPGIIAAANNYIFVNYSITDHVATNFNKTGVRPAVSIKYGIKVKSGNGTAENPFVLE